MNTTKTPSQLADDARQTANEAVESTREPPLTAGDPCRAVGCLLQSGQEFVLQAAVDLGEALP